MVEYQSWEFCEAIKCLIFKMFPDIECRKKACPGCMAYEFHNYLQEQGYKIEREVG